MEMTTMEVAVHKANIPLLKGETLRQFTSALRDAGGAHLKRKLNLTEKDSSYMIETMSNVAVFDVFRPSIATGRVKFYAVKFTRSKAGVFEFGETIEVRRITSFEAIATGPAGTPVTKNAASMTKDDAMVHIQKRAEERLDVKVAKGKDGLSIGDSAFARGRVAVEKAAAEVKKHTNVFGAGNWLWAGSFLWDGQ